MHKHTFNSQADGGPSGRSFSPTMKGWFLFGLAFLSLPAWLAMMWWFANERSGWNELVEQYGSAPADVSYLHKSAIIGVIKPNGRRYVFADSDSGSYRRGKIDYGFDETGFWMRGQYRGFTYGPARSLFIPWSDVRRRDGLIIHLQGNQYRFYVQEQILLDAVEKYVR